MPKTTRCACVREATPAPYTAALPLDVRPLIAAALDAIEDAAAHKGETFANPTKAGEYFCLRLGALDREVLAVAFLDCRHRLLACEELFYGSLEGAEVHPREIAKRALHHNAGAVILAHNHPSGEAEPSAADRGVTARVKQGLALLDVRLLDHFVVAGSRNVSLASRGWV